MAADTIRWEDAGDGVVNLVLDDPNQSANTMNADFGASMKKTVERLEAEKDQIAGVVITSAKKTFFAGGDLRDLKKVTPETADEFAGWVRENKALLRRLETLGKPVVAAINGAALGGGLEIALACHRRIVVDDPKIQLGQPEVQLGLLPGAGGVVRVTRMLGIQDCGLVIAKKLAESQVLGAMIQGVSYALHEQRIMDKRSGRMLNGDFLRYKISGSIDVPQLECHMHSIANGHDSVGAAGLGEPPSVASAAAVANAVFHALGAPVRHLPITPDKVLAALAAKRG
jgi:hypothetical protein